MKKLQYIASAAPTCWNIVDVPVRERRRYSCRTVCATGSTRCECALEDIRSYMELQLAKERCILIHKENQDEVYKAIWAKQATSSDSFCQTPSKLYDIPEGMEFELKNENSPKSFNTNNGEIVEWTKKPIYILKSKVEEKIELCPKCRSTDFKSCHSMRCPMREVEEEWIPTVSCGKAPCWNKDYKGEACICALQTKEKLLVEDKPKEGWEKSWEIVNSQLGWLGGRKKVEEKAKEETPLRIALNAIQNICDNQNPTHEEIWRLAEHFKLEDTKETES